MLNVNDQAPDFSLTSDGQDTVSLDQFRGNRVVVWFYPKDQTPGCTQQACDFRDMFGTFLSRNVILLGISPDGPDSHQTFRTRHDLPFVLLCDPEGQAAMAWGVPTEKTEQGLRVERTTFMLDESGKILHIWRKVKVTGHIEDILASLDDLDRRHDIHGAGL
jgi:peroxiredoxin Q/BCP